MKVPFVIAKTAVSFEYFPDGLVSYSAAFCLLGLKSLNTYLAPKSMKRGSCHTVPVSMLLKCLNEAGTLKEKVQTEHCKYKFTFGFWSLTEITKHKKCKGR